MYDSYGLYEGAIQYIKISIKYYQYVNEYKDEYKSGDIIICWKWNEDGTNTIRLINERETRGWWDVECQSTGETYKMNINNIKRYGRTIKDNPLLNVRPKVLDTG